MSEIKLDYEKMNGFGLRPVTHPNNTASSFIPFEGWKGYEQSDLLEPWSDSTRGRVKWKTGLDFPPGTKGFPLELIFWLWRDHEFFLEDFFDTSVSNKIEIAAKDVLKTGFETITGIFIMANFDFAENMSLTKYQNQLYQVPGAVSGYLDFIKEETGLSLHSCFDLPDRLDDRASNIHFTRSWYKVTVKETTSKDGTVKVRKTRDLIVKREWMLRSFDKPHKITNTPKRKLDGAIVWVNMIEPVLYDDPNDISAKEMMDTWSVNKSSIFRYARDRGVYAQMSSDMNNWNPLHDFPKIADLILPYDIVKLKELKTMVATDTTYNFKIRRLTRFANTFREMTEDEWRDYYKEEKQNKNLWLAKYWGAPYSSFGETPYTYLYSIMNVQLAQTPSVEEMLEFDKNDTDHEIGYHLDLGVDYGTNHATTLKASHWIPSIGALHREHIWRVCNYERKKEDGLEPLSSDEILSELLNAVCEYIYPIIKSGFKKFVVVYWDQGSWAMGEIFQAMISSQELQEMIIVLPGEIHGKNGREAKIHFDNEVHSYGVVTYDENNQITLDQYRNTTNRKGDWEKRDENNQMLDEIDATNIAESNIRDEVMLWLLKRRKSLGGS